MTKTNEPIRKTVYLEEKLVRQAEILFGEAEVDSFSAFVAKAIENYITKLVIDKNGDLLSKEIRKAIHEEISPTNTRMVNERYYQIIFPYNPDSLWTMKERNRIIASNKKSTQKEA